MDKIDRFYEKIPGSREKSKLDRDFDLVEDTLEKLRLEVEAKDVELLNDPLEAAFKSRVGIILFQNKLRAYHILRGIIGEMNNNNVPAVIPLVRTYLELAIQLGYILRQIDLHDYEHLLKEPLMKLLLGNKNDKAGPFAIGRVESINILTMIPHAGKAWVGLGGESNHIEEVYADLSNQSHPNYMSNMLYSTISEDGTYKTLDDIGEDMESLKGLAFPFYFDPLIISISFYRGLLGGIYDHEKMSD